METCLKICRFESPSGGVSLGVVENGYICDLGVSLRLETLYAKAKSSGSNLVSSLEALAVSSPRLAFDEKILRAPIVPAEIWGAGVTYLRSRDARESETRSRGLYDYVYTAARPEIFFKDSGLRCRGPGEEICVRSDSRWSVPEPELTIVFDEEAEVVGYTIGNDVSSRDIEGENPLYLPQAKIYTGSSAIGPFVVTGDEIKNPNSLRIEMNIMRGGTEVFKGSTNTSMMKRSVDELAKFLKKDNTLRTFTLLMTGTSVVPPDDFTLHGGDLVEITIGGIGTLRNPVRQL